MIERTPGVRRYQVFFHVHVFWFDETQLGSSLPHDADGPADKKRTLGGGTDASCSGTQTFESHSAAKVRVHVSGSSSTLRM